jgi:hypothetical protein
MPYQISDEQIYEEAKKRVEEKRDFLIHLIAYIVVNAVLVLVWAFTSRGFPWFIFPLGGWGIGLFFHFMGVFVFPGMSNRDAIEREAEKIRRRQG